MCVCPPMPFYVDHGGSRCVCVFVLPCHSTWIMGGVGVCVCVCVCVCPPIPFYVDHGGSRCVCVCVCVCVS